MACDCLKKQTTDVDKIITQAFKESEIEKEDYIVYEENGKIYYDRKTCWEKAGRPGKIQEIIYHI